MRQINKIAFYSPYNIEAPIYLGEICSTFKNIEHGLRQPDEEMVIDHCNGDFYYFRDSIRDNLNISESFYFCDSTLFLYEINYIFNDHSNLDIKDVLKQFWNNQRIQQSIIESVHNSSLLNKEFTKKDLFNKYFVKYSARKQQQPDNLIIKIELSYRKE